MSKRAAQSDQPETKQTKIPHIDSTETEQHPECSGLDDDALRDTGEPSNTCAVSYSTLEEAGFPGAILQEILAHGFTAPTPIQARTWPIINQGRDVIGIAETGSGKTLAFGLPAVTHAASAAAALAGPLEGPLSLVLTPTRELAMQIDEAVAPFCTAMAIEHLCVCGGVPKATQMRVLQEGVHVLAATPGRLIDLMGSRGASLGGTTFVVIDEADRMLSMGFTEQVQKIIAKTNRERQSLLWSATWPPAVHSLAATLLSKPVTVALDGNESLSANDSITQRFHVMEDADKLPSLQALLERDFDGGRVLCFCATKRRTDALTRSLRLSGWPALAIHGDKCQLERDWVLKEFREGSSPIMLATDVAARGLDVKDVKMVVNFDMPAVAEEYIHRIGRTGRAGCSGSAISFFVPADARLAQQLLRVLAKAKQPMPIELLRFAAASNTTGAAA